MVLSAALWWGCWAVSITSAALARCGACWIRCLGLRSAPAPSTPSSCSLSESLVSLVEEAAEAIRQDKVGHMGETGGPIGNADGNTPERKRGWLWVMVTPTLAVFQLALSRSAEVAKQYGAFGGGMGSQQDRPARTQPAPTARLNPSRAHTTGLKPVVCGSLGHGTVREMRCSDFDAL